MSEIELIILGIIGVFITFKIIDGLIPDPTGGNGKNPDGNIQQNPENNAKIYKKVEKLNLGLEGLLIKREEIENEIQELEMESNLDYEKESQNSTKIRKLNLNLKHLNLKIDKMNQEIYDLNMKLQGF